MIGCIIQARMGSTRLPGKVLKKINGKVPMLKFQLDQLKYSKCIEKIVVATTNMEEDDEIVNFCKANDVECFRGESENVLDRYYQCAKKFNFSIILRIPSDKPLIDPEIVDEIIGKFDLEYYDYVSNFLTLSYPSGTEVEVLSSKTLESVWKKARLPSELEHVTRYIHTHQDEFNLLNIEYSKDLSNIGWAVDRIEDLELVNEIVSKITKRPILMNDILELFGKEPSLAEINRNVDREEGNIKSLKDDEDFLKL
jgi:spore coat polysaccharide biosynthesis protein SpsF